MMDSRSQARTCPRCNGSGTETKKRNGVTSTIACRACNGDGSSGLYRLDAPDPLSRKIKPRRLPM